VRGSNQSDGQAAVGELERRGQRYYSCTDYRYVSNHLVAGRCQMGVGIQQGIRSELACSVLF
jgi:hypothetical protein